ncbi:MAG TPA: FHA domain-containing protein [Chloroflexia bacterium]|nr:FHA domain-containing protein [Chloroflexia bacterium]
MICPNCGNENPEDYVFCDECGARLQNMPGAEAEAVSAPLGTPDDGGSAGDGGAGQWQSSGGLSSMGDASDMDAMGTSGGAGMDSDSGMGDASSEYAMPAGSASQGEPAFEMDGGDQGQSDQAEASSGQEAQGDSASYDAWQPIGGQFSIGQTPTGPTGMEDGDPQAGEGDDESAAMPVTEDTMESAPAGDDGDSSSAQGDGGAGEEESAMPGVVPMMGSYSDTEDTSAQGGTAQGMDATAGSASAGGGEWASAALNYLDQAQQAAGQGDWGGFGEALGNLRTYLQTASQGMQSSGAIADTDAGVDAGSMMQPASMDTSSDESGTPSGIAIGGQMPEAADAGSGMDPNGGAMAGSRMPSEPLYESSTGMEAGGGAGVATLEPAAEAGSLGAEVMPEVAEAGGTMARLVMIATGAELPLPDQEEITVGREDPSSGIFPDIDLTPYGGEDGGVSRRHARLLHIDDEFFVEDLQSTNYTKLDGQRLPAHVRERLEDGARLDFGRVATIFRRS